MKILNTSRDRELLTVRSAYLWALGFEVDEVLVDVGLQQIAENAVPFDVAVLCYTLTREQKISLIERIRTIFPSTQILELYLTDVPLTGNAIQASEFRRMLKSMAMDFNEPLVASEHIC